MSARYNVFDAFHIYLTPKVDKDKKKNKKKKKGLSCGDKEYTIKVDEHTKEIQFMAVKR